MEAKNFSDALADTQQALDKAKLQQKYQKISTEIRDTLARLSEELGKRVAADEYQTIAERSYRHQNETTDL